MENVLCDSSLQVKQRKDGGEHKYVSPVCLIMQIFKYARNRICYVFHYRPCRLGINHIMIDSSHILFRHLTFPDSEEPRYSCHQCVAHVSPSFLLSASCPTEHQLLPDRQQRLCAGG